MKATVVLDVGGTHIRLGHLEGAHVSEREARLSTAALRAAEPVRFLAAAVRDYAAGLELEAVVMGAPVSLDRDFDVVLSSPNIPGLEGLALASCLRAELGCPVVVERDIVLLLMGEWRSGAARGASSALGVFIGTGIGASLLQDGLPYRGASGGAVELGHIPLRAEGRPCVCGNVDCLEAYASGHLLKGWAREAGVAVGDLFTHFGEGSALAKKLQEYIRDLAYGIAAAINLLDPEVVVVGGGIPAMEGFPREVLQQTVHEHLRRPVPAEKVRLAWAELGHRAAVYGAPLLRRLRT